MRTLKVLVFILIAASFSFASDDSSKQKYYEEPILLTSAGQSADVLIMKGLCLKTGLNFKDHRMATADSIAGFKTVILVAGGSTKGLGAAKVDIGMEAERVKALVEAAKEASVSVITFHIGGDARRGALSDPFNRLAAEAGEVIVVSSNGDEDGFFRKIADKRKARYIHIDKSFEVVDVLKELFNKTE